MPPDLEEVRRWVQKAEHDRINVELLLAQAEPLTDVAAFHCQQAAEKLLKAYLVFREHDFERTHDLRALTNLCATFDPAFGTLLDHVEPLTPYGVRFRYPGPNDPTVDQVRAALTAVAEVRAFVVERLPGEVVP